jgi:electron transfer flavoprotein-quinone oxidoreductase
LAEPVQKDLIIIGSGLSGLTAGIVATAGGMNVIIIESGEIAASQNPLDELAYPHALKRVLGNVSSQNEILTPIERRAFWITTPDGHSALECYKTPDEDGKTGFVANRPDLDLALADRFRNLGGEIATGIKADFLKRNEAGSVVGVGCNDGEIEYNAALTILAEGANSQLADHLLERDQLDDRDCIFVAKEILIKDGAPIASRLTGNDSTAASIILLGDPLGIGFSWARIIAWRDRIALKIYFPLDLMESSGGVKPLLESIKMHPSVEPIVRNLDRESLSTGIIPVGGFEKYPDALWGKGFLVTGKAARLYHPFDCRMTDYSIVSGALAGEAAYTARIEHKPEYPSAYPQLIKDSFLTSDRDSMTNFMNFMRNKKEFASSYPEIFMLLIDGIFTMDNRRKREKKKDIERQLRALASPWDMSRDFIMLLKQYG